MQNSSELSELIIRIVESVLDCRVPGEHANLFGLGASSMDLIRIINRLEDETGVRPDFERVNGAPTIMSLTAAISESRHAVVGASPAAGAMPETVTGSEDFDLDVHALLTRRAESVREFAPVPVTSRLLGQLLSALKWDRVGGGVRARYASAGALFGIEVYLYVKPGRVTGLPVGFYRYGPIEHRLSRIFPELRIERNAYEPIVNAPLFDRSAFALFFISKPSAMRAKYGNKADAYCLLEAGGMAQVLRDTAPGLGLGLCPIGEFNFEAMRAHFPTQDDREYVYSLLGGLESRSPTQEKLEDLMSSFKVR